MNALWLSVVAASCLMAAAGLEEPQMVNIPGGECPIGATLSHEGAHKPKIDEFRIAKFTVTNREYKQFIDATGHTAPETNIIGSKYRLWTGRSFPPEIARQPVVNVSWLDSVAYCQWLSKATGKKYRLPTEEEWELAARGGLKKKAYPWGDQIDGTMAWYGRKWDGVRTIQNVDYGKPNDYELYGMAGNVWQWTADWYVPTYDGRPVVEELNLYRVLRGGSWANDEGFAKLDYRNFYPPDFRDFFVGFRLAE